MALSATAPPAASTPTNLDHMHHPQSSRNSTPSISPLSTPSRPHDDRDAMKHSPPQPTAAQQQTLLQPHHTDEPADVVMRDDQDDRSSSLSDFDGTFDDQENTNLAQSPSQPRPRLEEADSEAETERLDATPQKLWQPTDTGRTPSKLNQAINLSHDHLSDIATSPISPTRDPQSQSPSRRPILSPSSVAGQKRKRSAPPSEPDSPLSEAASDPEDTMAPARANGTFAASSGQSEKSVEEANAEETTEVPLNTASPRLTPEPDEADENPYISPMKAARLKGKKHRAKRQKETPIAQKDHDVEDERHAQPDDTQEDDDSAAKSEEDRELKKKAREEYTRLAEQFNIFRAKLQAEKLAALETELEQLNRPQPIHPEYVAQVHCITARRDTKIQQEYARLRYKTQALQIETLAEHAQLHTQFFQEAREAREDRLSELGTMWYDIQKERRQFQADETDKYTYKFPTKFSDQIRNQANYNKEVSIISGVQRYVGFPAAPEIHGARPLESDQDLKAMRLPITQPQPVQPTHFHAGMGARAAQEKWVEQNPWANAQHPYHQQSRSPFNYQNPPTNPSVNLFRQGPAQDRRTHSPFTTPLPPQRKPDYLPNGLNSAETIAAASDPPSSARANAPPTDKTHLGVIGGDDGSPTGQLKVRSALGNPLNRDDRRNFSNISSTSTIDAPNDSPAAQGAAASHDHDRRAPAPPHNPYASHASLPVEVSASQQPFPTSTLHAQHGKPEDRRPELYDSVNFRPAMGAYGTPMPLFAGGSPVRKEGQRAT